MYPDISRCDHDRRKRILITEKKVAQKKHKTTFAPNLQTTLVGSSDWICSSIGCIHSLSQQLHASTSCRSMTAHSRHSSGICFSGVGTWVDARCIRCACETPKALKQCSERGKEWGRQAGSIPAFSTIWVAEVFVVDTNFMSWTYSGFYLEVFSYAARRIRRTHFQRLLQGATSSAFRGRYPDGATQGAAKRGSTKPLYDARQRQPLRLSANQ